MHAEVTERVLVDAPLDAVWSLYDDPGALQRWAPNVLATQIVGGERKRLGSYVRTKLVVSGFERTMEEQVTRYEPPRRSTVTGRMPGWLYSVSLDLENKEGGVECTYRCTSEYSFLLAPFVPLLEWMNASMLRDSLAALKRAAETRS